VSACVQVPNMLRLEESGPSGPAGGYKKVSAPAALFQFPGYDGVRAKSAIVERQEQGHLTVPLARAVDYADRRVAGGAPDRIQMCAEIVPIQLIPPGVARTVVWRTLRLVEDVVITDGYGAHMTLDVGRDCVEEAILRGHIGCGADPLVRAVPWTRCTDVKTPDFQGE
jgi:hypothetical protein